MVRELISEAPRLTCSSASSTWALLRATSASATVDGDLVGPLVDGEQQVADIDDLAVAEVQLVDEARDARADLDRGDGFEAAGKFVPLSDPLGQRVGDGNRHGRRTALGEGCGDDTQSEGGGENKPAKSEQRVTPLANRFASRTQMWARRWVFQLSAR